MDTTLTTSKSSLQPIRDTDFSDFFKHAHALMSTIEESQRDTGAGVYRGYEERKRRVMDELRAVVAYAKRPHSLRQFSI